MKQDVLERFKSYQAERGLEMEPRLGLSPLPPLQPCHPPGEVDRTAELALKCKTETPCLG